MQHYAGRSHDESKEREQKRQREHGRRRRTREKKQDKNVSEGTLITETRLLEKKIVEPAMNADDSYVQRWLAGTREENATQNVVETKDESNYIIDSKFNTSSNLRNQPPLESMVQPGQRGHKFGQSKKRHRSLSDSSILPSPPEPVSNEPSRDDANSSAEARRVIKRHRSKSRISSIRTLDHQQTGKAMFEKRARHKTREDRYEPKAKKSKQDKGQEKDTKRTTSRRLKKRDKNKPKKDGAELMRNFSSKSIGQDRLTFRPSYGLGLFNNGRSSDPTTSGVPDLAFSEMDSLQQNEKRRHTTEKELAIAKSRQKEKRKTSKPVEDISAFFNQFRKPLHEINVENGQKRSRHMSKTENACENPTDDRIHGYASSERVSLPRRKASVSINALPRRSLSYVSWSETRYSPSRSERNFGTSSIYRPPASPTPESVWRTLEATGVFLDTGIQSGHQYSHSSEERLPQNENSEVLRHVRQPSAEIEANSDKDSSSVSESSNDSSYEKPRKKHRRERSVHTRATAILRQDSGASQKEDNYRHRTYDNQDLRRFKASPPNRHETAHHEKKKRDISDNRVENAPKLKRTGNGITVEHFDRELGWHQEPDHTSSQSTPPIHRSDALVPEVTVPEITKENPISREELAKRAKIRRPATTLPVLKSQKDSNQLVEQRRPTTVDQTQTSRPHTSSPHRSRQREPIPPQGTTSPSNDNNPKKIFSAKKSDATHRTTLSERVARIEKNLAKQSTPIHVTNTQEKPNPSPVASQSEVQPEEITTRLGLPLRGGFQHEIVPKARSNMVTDSDSLFLRQAQQGDHDFVEHRFENLIDDNDAMIYGSPPVMIDRPYLGDNHFDELELLDDKDVQGTPAGEGVYDYEYEDTMMEHDNLPLVSHTENWQHAYQYDGEYPHDPYMIGEKQLSENWYEYDPPHNNQQYFEPRVDGMEEVDNDAFQHLDFEGDMYPMERQPYPDVNENYW